MKYNNLILFSITLIFASIFFTVFDIDSKMLLFLLSLFCYLILFIFLSNKRNTHNLIIFPVIFLALFFAGSRVYTQKEEIKNNSLKSYIGQKVSLEGVVTEIPDKREASNYFVLGELVNIKTGQVFDGEKILLKTGIFANYEFGEKIAVEGKLSLPFSFPTKPDETEGVFDYKKYLSIDDIGYTMSFASSSSIKKEKSLKGELYTLKEYLNKGSKAFIKEPESGLLSGILFGEKHALADEELDKFTRTGLIHIVVLSGYNISLILSWSLFLLAFLPFMMSQILSLLLVFIFIIMTGASTTAIRSGVMAAIYLLSKISGRVYLGVNTLFVAGAGISFYNPKIAAYDPSFHLSFLATLGLLVFTPYFDHLVRRQIKWKALREIVSTTLAVHLMVVPYIVWYIKKISLIGLLSNIIVAPLIPAAMISGMFFVISYIVFPAVGAFTFFIPFVFLHSIVYLNDKLSMIPFASVSISISFSLMMFLYFLIYLLFHFKVRGKIENF
jgi:competence protein ComEC